MEAEIHKEVDLNEKYLPIYDTNKSIILITGGRGSGKSFGATTVTFQLTYEAGHVIMHCRYTLNSADESIIPEFREKVELFNSEQDFIITKKEAVNIRSGTKYLFRGINTSSGNQTAKLKGQKDLTTFIVDEAEEWLSEDDYDKIRLSIRKIGVRNRVIIIMNPSNKNHFVYKKYIKDTHKLIKIDGVDVQISTHPRVEHIHTTYYDNIKNLSTEFLQDVADMKTEHDIAEDKNVTKYAYSVIARWKDRVEGAIFTNWIEGEFDESLPYGYGADYGYSNDPTTLVKVAIDEKREIIYLDEQVYSTGLSSIQTYQIFSNYIEKPNDLIVAESAEPRLNDELKSKGLNIKPAIKGPDSVRSGIKMMQDYTLVITSSSSNLKIELNEYAWSDKKSETPMDKFNHLIDAARYYIMNTKRKTSTFDMW